MSCCVITIAQDKLKNTPIDFYGDTIQLNFDNADYVDFKGKLSENAVLDFYHQMEDSHYETVINNLIAYREKSGSDDWLFYQLIRKTAETISPKKENYIRYTLYKWFFLVKSGYDAEICVAGDTILFYTRCEESIYDIPYYVQNGKQYVCLNYHDYKYNLNLTTLLLHRISVTGQEGRAFSYKLTRVPVFKASDYQNKDISFDYQDVSYHFRVKVNDEVKNLYANYPVVDYPLYFNAPMSKETYNSLIPVLKEIVTGMNNKKGIDYLMRFTRYAFLYRSDKENFGREKGLSPEQTLLYDHSDCEDHAALFFFLVKEIYHLPMLVLAYPTHVTIAVKLDKASGTPIIYDGNKYYICEPTPQLQDLTIGHISRKLKTTPYQVAYVYKP